MNTNMTGFRWLSKVLASLCMKEGSLSIEKVKTNSDHNLHSNIPKYCLIDLAQCDRKK